jgi:hypothetical protein
MIKLEIEIPEAVYKKALDQYGSRKKVEDILSHRLESAIRKNRKLITRPEPQRTTVVSIHMKDYLLPYLNQLLIERSESKQNFLTKMLKRLIK